MALATERETERERERERELYGSSTKFYVYGRNLITVVSVHAAGLRNRRRATGTYNSWSFRPPVRHLSVCLVTEFSYAADAHQGQGRWCLSRKTKTSVILGKCCHNGSPCK